ncbi:MAG: DUF2271 domain-containing protein [Phycisphaerae bacterium]|jgi:hypothetical protein|nr:DUF2271 domain-containing protein [Phycisphaerae bacterium]
MDDRNTTNTGGMKKTLAAAVAIAVCFGGVIGYLRYRSRPADGSIEISFRINDPLRYPADEPLKTPQTVVWLEDAAGNYVQSLLVSDWTAGGGWKKKHKLPDGRKIIEICPQWQAASGWPKKHSKKVIDAVSKATPETGVHAVSIKCRDLKLSVGTYRYLVQTSVAPEHTIICTGTIYIGDRTVETTAEVAYNPEMHEDAGGVLSNVTARYTP